MCKKVTEEKVNNACEIAELLKDEIKLIFNILENDKEESHGETKQRAFGESRNKSRDATGSSKRDS